MNTTGSHYLVMYDVTHPATLQKVAKALEKFGFERINYSVWLGHENPGKNTELSKRIKYLLSIPETEDSQFYYFPITPSVLRKMRTHTGHSPEKLDFWLGERKTQFL